MNKSEQINELATALAKAQGEIENASKNSTNPAFRSKYADLAEVLNTVRPVFSSHGLSITQFPGYEDGIASLETVMLHSSGQWMSSVAHAAVTKQDAQGVGSAITYLRRYSLAAVAGIAQEDDDATAAVGGSHKRQSKPDVMEEQAKAAVRQALQQCPSLADVTTLWNKTAPTIREAIKAEFTKRREALEAMAV